MGLKAPGILTFMLVIVLTVLVLVVYFVPSAEIPFIKGNEFYALLLAHAALVFGCVMRGL